MNNEIHDILSKIGLTSQESTVYLALLTLQESKTGSLCKETKIASSNIYKILDKLIEKGLISYRVQNNIKTFIPSNPEALNELFLEKQKSLEDERKEIQELVKKLKTKEIQEEPQSNYKYYEGIPGIKSMWHEINSLLNRSSKERIYAPRKEAFEHLVGFYDEHHKLRNKFKAKARIIIPEEFKSLASKRKNKNIEVKITSLKNNAEWGVVDDVFYIQYATTKTPRGFLVKDKIFAETFKETFDKVWKSSK